MIIVNCPSCHSKFRFSGEGLIQDTIKMRCSICQHIFSYTIEPEVSLEKEFDMLLSSTPEEDAPAIAEPPAAPETVFEEASMEITRPLKGISHLSRNRKKNKQPRNQSYGKSTPSLGPVLKHLKRKRNQSMRSHKKKAG